jgi:hypothetical protein
MGGCRRTAQVAVGGQGVQDQDGVGVIGAAGTPRLVGDGDGTEGTAGLEPERTVGEDLDELALTRVVTLTPRPRRRHMLPGVH